MAETATNLRRRPTPTPAASAHRGPGPPPRRPTKGRFAGPPTRPCSWRPVSHPRWTERRDRQELPAESSEGRNRHPTPRSSRQVRHVPEFSRHASETCSFLLSRYFETGNGEGGKYARPIQCGRLFHGAKPGPRPSLFTENVNFQFRQLLHVQLHSDHDRGTSSPSRPVREGTSRFRPPYRFSAATGAANRPAARRTAAGDSSLDPTRASGDCRGGRSPFPDQHSAACPIAGAVRCLQS